MFTRAFAPLSAPGAIRLRPGRETWPALGIVAALAMLLTIGVAGGAIDYDGRELDAAFGSLVLLGGIGAALRRLGAAWAAATIQTLAVFSALAILVALASAMLATSALPYADAWLTALDRTMLPGFDWPAFVLALHDHRHVAVLFTHAYGALTWEPLALLVALCATGREPLAWRFLSAWAVTLLVCLAIFPWVPARGAYLYYGISSEQVPAIGLDAAWKFLPLLEGLRDGTITTLSSATLDGIITMPSFHAAGAVVLGWTASQVRAVRWPATALNTAMLLSAVPVGGHYVVDVIAGGMVGAAAIRLARQFHRSPSPCSSATA